MFEYCTRILRLSEQEAYLRITVARTSREYPVLVIMLRDGRLHLSAIARLAPHLTPDNAEALLGRATHMSKRRIEDLVAELTPRLDAPTLVRKLPEGRGEARLLVEPLLGPDRVEPLGLIAANPNGLSGPSMGLLTSPPASRAVIEPLAPARYKVQFTATAELRDKLERLQALMRSSVHDGDLASIIDQAVSEKLARLEARRYAKTNAPRKGARKATTKPRSRYIPASVRRVVEERDGGQCTYRDTLGRRCTKLHDLEFHHRQPYALGGPHSVELLCRMCRTHNTLMAEADYGKDVMGEASPVS
jgi:5-methylcytosine-specific restriction endonuclease McrA